MCRSNGSQFTATHTAAQVSLLEQNFHDPGSGLAVPSFAKELVVSSLLLANSCTNSFSPRSFENVGSGSQRDRTFRVFANRDARFGQAIMPGQHYGSFAHVIQPRAPERLPQYLKAGYDLVFYRYQHLTGF